jgi:hypothetical protein
MKTLINIINEKLKINSKSKVSSLTKDIAKYLGISETDAEVIETKYLYKEYFDLDKIYKKDLLASEFELVFLLAAMLVDDNAKVDDIERLGTVGYRKDIGHSNPYDYSWYEEPFSDQDNDYEDVLEYIQEQYKHNDNFNKLFKEVYIFCKNKGINNPEKFFDWIENIDII